MSKKFLPDVIPKIGSRGIVLWVANYPNRWESLKEQNFFSCSFEVPVPNAMEGLTTYLVRYWVWIPKMDAKFSKLISNLFRVTSKSI